MNYMFRLANELPSLDSKEDLRISPGPHSSPFCAAHPLCCSYSLLVPSLTAQLGLHVPSCPPAIPRAGLPTTVQAHKPTESPPRPALHRATNTVSLTICRGAVDRPSLTPVPRRSPASVHMDVHCAPRCACLLWLVMWFSLSLSPRPPCAFLAHTRANEHPLPESILRSAVKSSVFHTSRLDIPTSF